MGNKAGLRCGGKDIPRGKMRVNLAQASSIANYQQCGLWNARTCGARILPQANLGIVERFGPAKYLAIVDV